MTLIESGYFLQGYTRVDLMVDTAQDRVVELQAEYKLNKGGAADPEMAARIASWAAQLPAGMFDPLGYARENIDRLSPEMHRLLLEAWLEADPQAQVALASARYVQQDLLPGEVTQATVIGMLPTENELVRIELTGEQLLEVLKARRPLVAGLTETPDGYRLADGQPLDLQAIYHVLLPETLYLGGNYYDVARFRFVTDADGDRLARPDAGAAPFPGDEPKQPVGDGPGAERTVALIIPTRTDGTRSRAQAP